MFIEEQAIEAGAKLLIEHGFHDKSAAEDLASRLFIAMMEHYSSEPRLVRYSPSPQLQTSED